jgi:isoleucyl-tRNA synthetase
MATDYKETVFLPRTEFPMKAGLPKKEPAILESWQKQDLYGRLRKSSKNREKFTLHDGPPYANGHLHIGHALNKILKDVIVRSQQMMGFDADFVPGWDCHGLPIEWKVEERYRKKGKNKDDVPLVDFRRECREFAEGWIDIQRQEFKRLGVMGNWDDPYTTMTYEAEARIVSELGRFLMDGSLYRGAKPVMWSVVEKTALAEAEVEYHDHVSNTIYVKFPVANAKDADLEGAAIVIWTTTPWTIPGNRAVAYGPNFSYSLFEVVSVEEGSGAYCGERLVVASDLAERVKTDGKISNWRLIKELSELGDVVLRHPFYGQGYDFEVRVYDADFVEMETGSGFVHIAPGHGADDWALGMKHGIAVPETVGGDGVFLESVPLFSGHHVFKADAVVIEALEKAGALLAKGKLSHSYPHSWRSKAPLIFRTTPQWFISMDKNDLREKALTAIEQTRFVPEAGRNRIQAMVEGRPDWCVSRQRAWGVPITVFVEKKTGEPLRDQKVFDRIVAAVEKEGADAWFSSDPSRFLGPEFNADDFEQVSDILDVWFDSGATHAFVLEDREELSWPASLYLEGSDQHRGWFQSSLLESCSTRGRAPYDAVLTHGFVMGKDGQKMSKSLGNIVSPQDVVDQSGADILRLWVVGSDYSEDLRIGPEIVKQHADVYRRLRNTLRFLLGNLNGFSDAEKTDVSDLPELERFVLHRVWELDALLRKACDDYSFHTLFNELHNFCTVELSSFYFDIRKDSLYCDRLNSPLRRAARTVLDTLFDCLTAWFAPFICFSAEEAWLSRNPDGESVHLRAFPEIPKSWRDDVLAEKWTRVRSLRRVVTGALEVERAEKRIGSSLEGRIEVYVDEDNMAAMEGVDLAEIAISSSAELCQGSAPQGAFVMDDVSGVGVICKKAEGEKCSRCWKVVEDLGHIANHPEACPRCADAADAFQA